MSLSEWLTGQRQIGRVKPEQLLRVVKDRILWKFTIAHVPKGYGMKKNNNAHRIMITIIIMMIMTDENDKETFLKQV